MGLRPVSDLPFPSIPMGEWRDRAACKGAPLDWFFPERSESAARAQKLCAGCEVRADCLHWAMVAPERFGIWGGVSEKKRRGRRVLLCQKCGVEFARSGAEKVCLDCVSPRRLKAREKDRSRKHAA